jgi:hypothetical protein
MLRLAAASRALREAMPAALEPIAIGITHLGGVTGLLFGLSLLYWVSDRRATALVIAYAFGAYAVVLGLKAVFGLPRPPDAVWVIEASGFGFPSGHATAAAVVYGGLALEFDRVDSVGRAAPLVGLAVLIALSRVVLGVHFLGDVVVGLALGTGVVLAFHYGADGEPSLAFAVAAVLGVAALSTTWGDLAVRPEVFGIVGAGLAGALLTRRMAAVPHLASWTEGAVLVVVGLGFVVLLQLVGGIGPGPLAGLENAILVAGVLLMPRGVRWLWSVADSPWSGSGA